MANEGNREPMKGAQAAGGDPPVPSGAPQGQPPAASGPVEGRGGGVLELSDRTWEKAVEKAAVPVAVMFYSPSCAFCRQMEPYFTAYAGDFSGVVVFARINILANPWTAERYGVRSTPTFRFFCDGRPVQELVGAVYPAILKRTISEVLVHGKECIRNSTAIDYEITGYG